MSSQGVNFVVVGVQCPCNQSTDIVTFACPLPSCDAAQKMTLSVLKITPCSEISNSQNTPTCHLSKSQMKIEYQDENSNKNSIESNSPTSIICYPNPTSGVVIIKLPQDFNIKLYNINGQLSKIDSFNTNQISLYLS